MIAKVSRQDIIGGVIYHKVTKFTKNSKNGNQTPEDDDESEYL
ncbi:MAG: hypothetical protein WD648_03495 [Planctomycetaceae bacterium]